MKIDVDLAFNPAMMFVLETGERKMKSYLKYISGIDECDLTTAEKQIKNGSNPKEVLRDIEFEDMTGAEKKIWNEVK